MKTTKFSSIAVAMLITSLCLCSTVSVNVYASTISSIIKSDPRNVIQFMTNVTVVQQNSEHLQVTVVRKSDESIMYQTSSSLQEIYISTQGWESDDYTIHTNSEDNDYQVFSFTIE